MWNRGKHIGDLELEIDLDLPVFHKQMVVYMRT